MNSGFEELKKQIEELDNRSHDAVKEIFIYEREVSQTLLVVISAILAFLVTQSQKNVYIYSSIIALSLVLFLSIGMLIYRRNILKTYHQNLSMAIQEGEAVLQGESSSPRLPNNFNAIRKQASRVDLAIILSYILFFLGIILFVVGFSV
jgi:hypothetical protein